MRTFYLKSITSSNFKFINSRIYIWFVNIELTYTAFCEKYNTKNKWPERIQNLEIIVHCTTNNWSYFQRNDVHIRPIVTSLMSPARPCSISAELPNECETWKIMQICLVDVRARNISMWVGSNGTELLVLRKQACHIVTFRLVQDMLLRRWRVRERQAGIVPRMWPQHGTVIVFAWSWWNVQLRSVSKSTVEYCNECGTVCGVGSWPSVKVWISGPHAFTSSSLSRNR